MSTTASPDSAEPTRRSIRPRGEVPRLLTESARELFAAQGFDATAVDQIAAHAGVSKALLFRHFGNKSGLFQAAVAEPFSDFITECVRSWEQVGVSGRPPGTLASDLVSRLSELFRDNRELMLAVLAVTSFGTAGPEVGNRPKEALDQLVERLESLARVEAAGRGVHDLDVPVFVRAIIATTAGLALLEPWLLAAGPTTPDRSHLEHSLTEFMLRVVSPR